jgi:hypothetical protein
VELREAIRVATEAKRTLRLYAWSVNEIGRAAAFAARTQPLLDWDDDDYGNCTFYARDPQKNER